MTLDAQIPADDNPLAPASSRFALGPGDGLPGSAEPASHLRPFGLRFMREPARSAEPAWPPHRYCEQRQVLVSDDDRAESLVGSGFGWDQTTVGDKDGHGKRQEDWKPDEPFFGSS